jgi:hypothetical protein
MTDARDRSRGIARSATPCLLDSFRLGHCLTRFDNKILSASMSTILSGKQWGDLARPRVTYQHNSLVSIRNLAS